MNDFKKQLNPSYEKYKDSYKKSAQKYYDKNKETIKKRILIKSYVTKGLSEFEAERYVIVSKILKEDRKLTNDKKVLSFDEKISFEQELGVIKNKIKALNSAMKNTVHLK
jgi:hypothetical protein